MSRLALVAVVVMTLSFCTAAQAKTLQPGERGISAIDNGVWQIGLDSSFIRSDVTEGDVIASRTNAKGTVLIRYFLLKNLGLSLRFSGIYRSFGDNTDLGYSPALWGNFYVRLGNSIFITPGAGVGYVSATRDTPDPSNPSVSLRSSISAVGIAVELPIVFFGSARFSVKAGPEFEITTGTATPEGGGTSTDLFALDGAFKVGVTYSF